MAHFLQENLWTVATHVRMYQQGGCLEHLLVPIIGLFTCFCFCVSVCLMMMMMMIIIIIIFFNPRKNEGGKKIKKSRKRFEVEN